VIGEPEQVALLVGNLESDVVIYLAGKVAERRAVRGSAPGWQRFRVRDELRAFHESGHAIAQWAGGRYPWKLSIRIDENVRVGKSGHLGGYASAGTTPEPPGPIELPARLDCDLRLAARACQILSLCEPPHGWRGAVRVAHRLRARSRDLVEQHWQLVVLLAGELVRHQELDQAQIERVLKPRPGGK
jgi:hypothetical protein